MLNDESIIRGKIIKMNEDKLIVLTEYGEMVIAREKIKNTFFNDAEYEKVRLLKRM